MKFKVPLYVSNLSCRHFVFNSKVYLDSVIEIMPTHFGEILHFAVFAIGSNYAKHTCCRKTIREQLRKTTKVDLLEYSKNTMTRS